MNLTVSGSKGCELREIGEGEAARRHLLTRAELDRLHLEPIGDPIAFSRTAAGKQISYYDPDRVRAAKVKTRPRIRKTNTVKADIRKSESGELPVIGLRRAARAGLFTKTALLQMYLEPKGEPVAQFVRRDGKVLLLFSREACIKLPRPCVQCGKGERYCHKLCRDCYAKELSARRAAGDARRGAFYGYDPKRVLFFDLELTGLYEYDEILSVSMVNGCGEVVFHSFVRPLRRKKWKQTEEIHGITPQMVKDSPTLVELAPKLRALLDGAQRVIAYGTSTDYSHLKRLYRDKAGRDRLHAKLLDCAAEFSYYITEHEIGLEHRSLTDAMAHFGLSWDGAAHTSLADTHACRLVFGALFPHYFEREE